MITFSISRIPKLEWATAATLLCRPPTGPTESRGRGEREPDLRKPFLHPPGRILNRHRPFKNLWMCSNANKAQNDQPSQSHAFVPLKTAIPPVERFVMMRGAGVVGINEQVNVWQNHR